MIDTSSKVANHREHIVIAKNLWKIYKTSSGEYPALRGVNMYVKRNEFLAIVGPSGSGKTTLLNIIGGLDKPTKGEIRVDGIDLSKLGENELADYRSKYVGFVFQFYNLFPYLTAIENVELPMAITGKSLIERRKRALKLLELVGLADKAFKRASELSGGEQQRVAIARALANNPKLILADEPTGNLDSVTGASIMKLFRELVNEEGATIIMVTHNPENLRFVDRMYRLRDGKIVGEEDIRR